MNIRLNILEFDVIIIGSGGAGLYAALEISKAGKNCAVLTKVFPTRSHTVSAQGGITAALGNVHDDNWEWHMFDTIKGSDYLGDQDAIEYMCKTGPEVVLELEHMGVPFSRLKNGKIYQRAFGAQSINFGESQASRTASVADRTGHSVLHTLFQQNLKYKTKIFYEWYVIDLVRNNNGSITGCSAICIETGEVFYFKSKVTVLATGGAGRIFKLTTNSHINTGDGIGMVLRIGLSVQDMEMWQFHPTGIVGSGILITEGCRGEGGYLINKHGQQFMKDYAPLAKDLASRDVVSQAIETEIISGRGYENNLGKYVKLNLTHLGEDIIKARLPGIFELSNMFANINPIYEPIPVAPSCHYMMGGIPTKINGQVISVDSDGNEKDVPGLFAIGEVACVSVHGANRLGGNSLLDIVVFGRSAGNYIVNVIDQYKNLQQTEQPNINRSIERYLRWINSKAGEDPLKIKKELQTCMQKNFSIFRNEHDMSKGIEQLKTLHVRLKNAYLKDKTNLFNMRLIECLELENLIEVALATAISAKYRKESRGAHNRIDYKHRDDNNWLYHTIYSSKHNPFKRNVNLKFNADKRFKIKKRIY